MPENPRPTLLGIAVDTVDPNGAPRTAEDLRTLVLGAAAAGVHLVTLGDRSALDGGPVRPDRAGLEPASVLAWLAPQVPRLGLLAVRSATRAEPYHLSRAIATVDYVSGGRAGWHCVAELDDTGAVVSSHPAPAPQERAEHAVEVVEVVRGLWDTWEDDACVREVATGRYVDPARIHRLDHRGTHLAIRGPSATPRPPQGHPVVAVTLDGGPVAAALGPLADLGFVVADTPFEAAARAAAFRAAADGRPLRALLVTDRVGPAPADGIDGLLLTGVDTAEGLAALRSESRPVAGPTATTATTTLRQTLGLPRPVNRFRAATGTPTEAAHARTA